MKRNIFYCWLMVAFVIFASVSLGGCGGSSNKRQSGGGQDDVNPTMSDVWQDEEAAKEVVNKLNSGDVFLLLTVRIEAIEKKSDDSVMMKYYDMADSVFYDADNPEVPYNAAEVLEHYNSGDVIAIMNADLELVNTVRADLGLSSENADNFGESGILEAYGISCQRVNGLRNTFVYIVPSFGDMLSSDESGDPEKQAQGPESNDITDLPDNQDSEEKTEVIPEEYTARDFQIDRWVNFLKWMGQLGVMSLRNSAYASDYEVRAAANDDLTKIADAQTYTFDFCYPSFNSSVSFGDYNFTYSRCRDSFVRVIIYSAHSFTSGKDFYVVESNTTTSPKNYQDVMVKDFTCRGHDYTRNVVYGYTKGADTEFNIDGGGMGTSDVALIRHEPANINPSTSYSEGMQWEINGKVGVNKDGPSAEIGGGVSFNKSKSWSVSEYTLINESMKEHPASAKWWADLQNPNDTSSNNYVRPFVYWDGVSAKSASRNQLQYDTYFMWEVGKNYWKNHPNMTLRVKFNVLDGLCAGWCRNAYGKFGRWDTYYSWCRRKSLKLDQPAHTGVSKSQFAITATNPDRQTFTLYTEDSWTMKNIPSWVHFPPTDTSGSETGGDGKLLLFDVDANTTGSPRSATITISSGRDNVDIQIAQAR